MLERGLSKAEGLTPAPAAAQAMIFQPSAPSAQAGAHSVSGAPDFIALNRAWQLCRYPLLPLPTDSAPYFSIILPVRDRAQFLEQALLSLRAQTWASWEVIVVDDGSKDSTPELLACWQAQESRLKIVTQPPLGAAAARKNNSVRV